MPDTTHREPAEPCVVGLGRVLLVLAALFGLALGLVLSRLMAG